MIITLENQNKLAWDKMNGLIPAIVQHHSSGVILMQGYMNPEALTESLSSGKVTFYSRSKQRLWQKGEQSGHVLNLKQVSTDCDQDSLIVLADPIGPTCHTGAETCWHEGGKAEISFIAELEQLVADRKKAPVVGSYTQSLFDSGIKRMAQKVGEEGVEVALAATSGDMEELLNESADLLYHLIVLLQANDKELTDVIEVLKQRHAQAH